MLKGNYMMYGQLCTEFYDADKKFAPHDEVDFYLKTFNQNHLLLEPMCGSGRLLIPLLQAGLNVVGVDSSKAMLKSCKERANAVGLNPTLIESDIENLSLSQKYDGIIIPLGSFQLFYPRDIAYSVLQVLRKHLNQNGKLIMDLFVPWDALYKDNAEEFSEKELSLSDGSIIKAQHHNKANKFEQFITTESSYQKTLNGKLLKEEKEQIQVSWYYQYEMELILEKYGFKNIKYIERFLNGETHMTFIAE